MDQEVRRFRAAVTRENRGRHAVQRRYSPELQTQAVRYWQTRRQAGDGLREVAAALGVASWSLYRWTQRAPAAVRFARVQVEAPARPVSDLVVIMDARGARVEGLDVETAARLLALLR